MSEGTELAQDHWLNSILLVETVHAVGVKSSAWVPVPPQLVCAKPMTTGVVPLQAYMKEL